MHAADPATGTASIAAHWRAKWLKPRIARPEVLQSLEGHTLTHPVHHGAEVVLPPSEDELQTSFEDIMYEWDTDYDSSSSGEVDYEE